MDDPNVLYTTIIQVSGTIVAIFGGLLASYIVSRDPKHQKDDLSDRLKRHLDVTWGSLWALLPLTILGFLVPFGCMVYGPDKISDTQALLLVVMFAVGLLANLCIVFGLNRR